MKRAAAAAATAATLGLLLVTSNTEGPPRSRLEDAAALGAYRYPPKCRPVTFGSQPNERNPDGSYVWAEAYRDRCRINITSRGRDIPWTLFCTLIVHEAGHLHGLGHSPTRTNVMYRIISYRNRYWRCGSDRSQIRWPMG